jgi:hypothetical protein
MKHEHGRARYLGLFSTMVAWAIVFSPAPAAFADSPALTPVSAGWLETLNYYRVASGLAPVVEEKKYSDAVMNHMIYLAKTDPKLFVGQYANRHAENPASPFATQAGITLGGGNIWSAPSDLESRAIDAWIGAPFHSISALHEDLTATGYAKYQNEVTGNYETGMSNGTRTWAPRTKNIFFPAPDSLTRLYAWAGESPDPSEGCGSNFKDHKGLAIYASLLSAPSPQTSITLTLPTGKILSEQSDLCLINEHNLTTSDPVYGSAGTYIVKAEHMVIFFPKEELQPGLHTATINQPGAAPISWKFTVIDRYTSNLPWTNFDLQKSSIFKWDKVESLPSNPLLGYEVSEWRSNTFKRYRVQNEEFDVTQLMPGKVNLCVLPIATFTSSSCSSYWGINIPDFTASIKWKAENAKGTVITWNPINRDSQQRWSEYEILIKDSTGKVQSQQSSQNSFDTKSLPDGQYQICVHTINLSNAGDCDTYSSWEIHQAPAQKQSIIVKRPTSSKINKVGQTLVLSSLSQASSSTLFTPGVCKTAWVGQKLNVKGIKAGTCTVLFEALGDDRYLPLKKKISFKFTK